MAPVKAVFKPRIYIHAPYKPGPKQAILKKAILKVNRVAWFRTSEVFTFPVCLRGDTWSFDRAIEVMRQCDGALILALKRWQGTSRRTVVPIPSEYSHFEGALALSRGLPTIVVAEEGMHHIENVAASRQSICCSVADEEFGRLARVRLSFRRLHRLRNGSPMSGRATTCSLDIAVRRTSSPGASKIF